jgi:hypothetical protein
VPDNVRDAGFKARRRLVPQRTYRLGCSCLGANNRGKGEKVR